MMMPDLEERSIVSRAALTSSSVTIGFCSSAARIDFPASAAGPLLRCDAFQTKQLAAAIEKSKTRHLLKVFFTFEILDIAIAKARKEFLSENKSFFLRNHSIFSTATLTVIAQ
jgi:hypothetical protein